MARNLLVATGQQPPINVELLAHHVGCEIRKKPYHGQGKMAGMLDTFAYVNIIGVNELATLQRQRFIIAHMIGHLLMHKKPLIVCNSMLLREPEEVEASLFACELIIPTNNLKNDLEGIDIEEELSNLANKYEVTDQVMSFRLGLWSMSGD